MVGGDYNESERHDKWIDLSRVPDSRKGAERRVGKG